MSNGKRKVKKRMQLVVTIFTILLILSLLAPMMMGQGLF